MQHASGILQERESTTRHAIGCRCTARAAEWTWWRVCLRPNTKHRTLLLLEPIWRPPTPPSCRRSSGVSYLFYKHVGDAGLPSRGVSGEGGNKDRTTCELPAMAREGHRYNCGGGEPPPLTVSPLQHVGAVGGLKKMSPQLCPMLKGDRTEAAYVGR